MVSITKTATRLAALLMVVIVINQSINYICASLHFNTTRYYRHHESVNFCRQLLCGSFRRLRKSYAGAESLADVGDWPSPFGDFYECTSVAVIVVVELLTKLVVLVARYLEARSFNDEADARKLVLLSGMFAVATERDKCQ